MKNILIFYVIVINIIGFILMGVDKLRARRRKYRIPERTLFLIAIFLGSIGVLIGMYVFRHKTKHLSFSIGIPAILVVQLLCISFLFSWNSKRMSSPSQTVQNELELIQHLDADTIQSFVSYKNLTNSHIRSGSIGKETSDAVALFFQDFHYNIHNEKIDGDTATVSVNITNTDMHALAQDLCSAILRQTMSVYPSAEKMTASDYYQLLYDTLSENHYETVVTTAWFHLKKENAGWVILADETLEDELVSGFISYMNNPYILPASKVLDIQLDAMKQLDAAQWQDYLDTQDVFATYNADYYPEIDRAYFDQLAADFNYEILKCREDGNTASAAIRITSLDMPGILSAYKQSLLDYAATTRSIRDDAVQMSNETSRLLLQAIQENQSTRATDLDLTFLNNGYAWEIYFEDDFTNAVMGDMNTALNTFTDAPQTE